MIAGDVCAVSLHWSLLSRPQNFAGHLTRERIQGELGSQLSSNASLYFPNSEAFDNANYRWSTYRGPNISVIVEPATREDVAATIVHANSVRKPFLARSGGHGSANTLASVEDGFLISMHQFKQLHLAADEQSALLGGGLIVQEIIDALDASDKVTGWFPVVRTTFRGCFINPTTATGSCG